MPLPGGATDKIGNRYESRWTVYCITEILAARADSIRLEPPGKEGEGIEFWLRKGQTYEYHQVKRQNSKSGHWSIADLERNGVLSHFFGKLQDPLATCHFVSTHSAFQIDELGLRARQAASWEEFRNEFLRAKEHLENFREICHKLQISEADAYEFLKRVFVHTIGESFLQRSVENRLEILVKGDSANVAAVLGQLILDEIHHELTTFDVHDYLNKRGYSCFSLSQLLEQHPNEITEISPLLIGILVDLSSSMFNSLAQIPKRSNVSQKRLTEAINLITEKALAYCKTPEAEYLLPLFSLFLYGYGLGRLRHSVSSFIQRMGIKSQHLKLNSIPTDPVRNLFAEVATEESMPSTPDALTLNSHWATYIKSVEAQFSDIGIGRSILCDALMAIHERFVQERSERPYYQHPFLFVISDGNLDNAKDEDLEIVVEKIRKLGVRIVCCYVNPNNIVEPSNLYAVPGKTWPRTASRLFGCASVVSNDNGIEKTMLEVAQEKRWQIPKKARWFIQINQSQMLEDLVEILLSPLKDRTH
jgi:hypothetical protein